MPSTYISISNYFDCFLERRVRVIQRTTQQDEQVNTGCHTDLLGSPKTKQKRSHCLFYLIYHVVSSFFELFKG